MKRWSLLMMAMLSAMGSADAQQIGALLSFENHAPLFGRTKGHYPVDLNGDGLTDLPLVQECALTVMDGATLQRLWHFSMREEDGATPSDWGACSDDELQDGVEVLVFGSISFGGIPHLVVEIAGGTHDRLVAMIEPSTNVVSHEAVGRFFAAIERDGESYVILFSEEDLTTFIVGNTQPQQLQARIGQIDSQRRVPTARADFRVSEKYRAEPGWRLGYEPNLFDPPDDMDADGDGINDLALFVMDAGVPRAIAVYPILSIDAIWDVDIPDEHLPQVLKVIHGFADVDGDGSKELFAGDALAISQDGTVEVIDDAFVMLDVNDIDGDGLPDLIGLSMPDSIVVVYGAATETSTDLPDPLAGTSTLLPNYPNPFGSETTIPYFVAQANHVSLEVFDLLGRRVRVLVDGLQERGSHEVRWDGTDDSRQRLATGAYFYRLRVGDAVSTRQAVHVR